MDFNSEDIYLAKAQIAAKQNILLLFGYFKGLTIIYITQSSSFHVYVIDLIQYITIEEL